MKLIIAGGRDYQFDEEDEFILNAILGSGNRRITEVVSGGAKGADRGGELWAKHWNIPIKRFPADWDKHGKKAGPIRNEEMAKYADAVILFPGGRGTANMLVNAIKHDLKIYDLRLKVRS